MARAKKILHLFHSVLLSEKFRKRCEFAIVIIAIAGFIIHLLFIAMSHWGLIDSLRFRDLLDNPLVAIYTPFSFILIYEVYLLVYYLPQSTSKYVGKQYEIITLIVIRSIYNDIARLDFTSNWFENQYDLQFTYDIIATIVLFYLIFLFYRLNQKRPQNTSESYPPKMARFICMKKLIAGILILVFFFLATYNLVMWINSSLYLVNDEVDSIKDINKIFFDDFFTILIFTDVTLLLISLLYTHQFSSVIRNSAFIISTTLIKMSFGIEGIVGTILTVFAVALGVLILAIQNQYNRLNATSDNKF